VNAVVKGKRKEIREKPKEKNKKYGTKNKISHKRWFKT